SHDVAERPRAPGELQLRQIIDRPAHRGAVTLDARRASAVSSDSQSRERPMNRSIGFLIAFLVKGQVGAAQTVASMTPAVREYVSVDAPAVALAHVRLVDGTGATPRADQTVIFEQGKITWVGPAANAKLPTGARVLELGGHTVIPGIIGLHNHT